MGAFPELRNELMNDRPAPNRTLPPRTTTSTTTFKPRSLADLFKHRAGQKVEYPEGSEPRTEAPVTATTNRYSTSQKSQFQGSD